MRWSFYFVSSPQIALRSFSKEEGVETSINMDFPSDSVRKESACNAGDPGSIPGCKDPLEKEMETYSSILAWRIPWTEEPGGLVHGVARIRHDLATKPRPPHLQSSRGATQ